MQQRMKSKGVTVLAVSVDADENNYRRFLRDHSVALLTVRDADQKSNGLYGTSKFPETYIIDRNGVVRRKFIGAVDWTVSYTHLDVYKRQIQGALYKRPTVGRISSVSTVAFGGRRIALTTASATVAGDIIFFRGACGHRVCLLYTSRCV